MSVSHWKRRLVLLASVAGLFALALSMAGIASAQAAGFRDPFFGEHPGVHHEQSHPAVFSDQQLDKLTANPDCTLAVPKNPLTAKGLATPYVLSSAGLACSETSEGTAAFVQATILDPATGQVSVYDPEVVTAGTTAPVTPPVPVLPKNAVVAVWTGFNANVLLLTGQGSRQFVNFAQQGYDNSPGFFAALRQSVRRGKTVVPPTGTASSGKACPTTDDYSIVDQDPNDNVPVTYAFDADVSNGSDEQLLDLVLGSLGCSTWQVPSLDPSVSGGATSTDGLLQEEQASVFQGSPAATVPGNDEFVTSDGNFVPPLGDGQPDLFLLDLYRAQVGQPLTGNANNTRAFCLGLENTGAPRLAADYNAEALAPAPAFAQIGNNLALVLGARFAGTWGNLNCQGLTGVASPLQVTTDANGVATAETYNGSALPAVAPVTPPTTTPPVTTPPTTPPVTPPVTPPAKPGTGHHVYLMDQELWNR